VASILGMHRVLAMETRDVENVGANAFGHYHRTRPNIDLPIGNTPLHAGGRCPVPAAQFPGGFVVTIEPSQNPDFY
jgi:hypothetical protein